ncbi:MAG: glycosyltransferase [Chitinophagales bacterium]
MLKELLDTTGKKKTINKEDNYDIVVFCHLRWDFVYQRPQHIISRLAANQRVLFVEEPVGIHSLKTSELRKVDDNLTILQPQVNSIADIPAVLEKYMPSMSAQIGWFYSPAFVPLLGACTFNKVVYDCMDELSLFRGASSEITYQENALMERADAVFTGGKLLFESKRKQHSNVFCFPSSVDSHHFEKALNGIEIPSDMNLPGPIIGYYGVLDERIDFKLLDEAARLMPWASFVMVGPTAKISEAEMSAQSNIHYMGIRPYAQLPNYLKAFDIAMMPFAINDATRYISPTKTLEYMAANKPIISTPVFDVVRDYGRCISIVNTAEEFCAKAKEITEANDWEKKVRNNHYQNILTQTSWDKTVDKMKSIIQNL